MLPAMNINDELLIESFAEQPATLRIAVVTETFPPEVNGVAMTLGRIVDELVRRGHAIQLIRPRQKLEHDLPKLNGMEEILSPGMPVPSYGELRFGLPSKRRLVKLWTARRPDVVHVATEGPLGWSAVAAARKLQLPLTSSFHTNFQSYTQHYGLNLLKAPIENYLRKLHNRTQTTMVPTKALMSDLQRRGYQNVKLLSRGVAADLFSPSRRSQSLRDQWGANADDLVVMLVGRLAKEKNVGLAVSAFRAIQQIKPNAKLVFVGDGPLRQTLQSSCPDAVFTGVQKGDALACHYASGDIFLFPSLTETYGNVVPEALASGLAVVSYACAAAQELVVSGLNGMLVSGDREQEFIDTAVRLASSATTIARLRQAAAPSVAHLRWESIFDSFEGYLRRIVESGSAGIHMSDLSGTAPVITRASA